MTWSNVHCVCHVLCLEWITLEDIEMDIFFSNESLIVLSSIDMTAWGLFLPALGVCGEPQTRRQKLVENRERKG